MKTTKQETFEMMTFEECWQTEPLTADTTIKINTLVCFLSNSENQQSFAKSIESAFPNTKLYFVEQGVGHQKKSEQNYATQPGDRESQETTLKAIQQEAGTIDAILYLWALEDPSCIQNHAPIVALIQAIGANKLKTAKLLLAGQSKNDLDRCYLESWIGFERSLGLVLPNTKVAGIYQETEDQSRDYSMKHWGNILAKELQNEQTKSVLYKQEQRHVQKVQTTTQEELPTPLKEKGTYLITGGCGGLGLLFAKQLAKTLKANLILTGRSALNKEKKEKIEELQTLGAQVLYLQADICNDVEMRKELDQAKRRFGKIDGILHAAGIEGEQTILNNKIENFKKVLAPKIQGTLVLDEILYEEPVDFICYFSSTSAVLGDLGSCDYAVGNRFQMAYAAYRNKLRQLGEVWGQALVINWPLWRDGGMSVGDSDNTEMYLKTSGQRLLETEEGLEIFERLLPQKQPQHLVLVGKRDRVGQFLGLPASESKQESKQSQNQQSTNKKVRSRRVEMKGLNNAQCLEWDLKELTHELLKTPREKLDLEENLAEFGFDSITLAKFAVKLTDHFDIEVTPALFFGHSTLGKLKDYFLNEHKQKIEAFYKEEEEEPKPAQAPIQKLKRRAPTKPATLKRRKPQKAATVDTATPTKVNTNDQPIAIIGMSGRFPQARDIETMWQILAQGKDVVTEIPSDRFDWTQYYGDPSVNPEKTDSKWLGSIPGSAEFDPLFFEISPKEAENMDPRQRLLLQESWNALEDAGYGSKQLKTSTIGMFVGVEQGDYFQFVGEDGGITANHNGILAARLAYLLNFSGPNMAINTACSSGLVAAHQACLSLKNDECDTAIVAGVNLMLRPEPYVAMSRAGMLSKDGKCHTFDKQANGMVPGDAVVAIVLKRLSQAETDGNAIHAVIQGSGINYDGKTNGITAPNGVAQTELLKSVYKQHQINPESIEYIVTHGTGTKLGDPVEINALYDAFKESTQKQGFCALTSTKTNFGHTFAASGLVSLVALVKAFQQQTIPASLHCEQENDYIQWNNSPFYVNKENRDWPEKEQPRTGAVSAFGMSGTNAHMVLRSYNQAKQEQSAPSLPLYLLPLSAKTEKALIERVDKMVELLESKAVQTEELHSMAYTLQEGRQHFNHRLVIVVQGSDDALYLWKQAKGTEKLPNIFRGEVPRDFTGQKAMVQYASDLLTQSQQEQNNREKYQETLYALAELYCQGYPIAWEGLYGETTPIRLHLPTYPFAKDRYWVPASRNKTLTLQTKTGESQATLHPLVHQNSSDFSEQRFSSLFTGEEFFLADHIVKGEKVLPGVAYLEMAREAVARATGLQQDDSAAIQLKNVVWIQPIAVADQPLQVHITLTPEEDEQISWEVYSDPAEMEGSPILYCQGKAALIEKTESHSVNPQALQAEYNQRIFEFEECYEAIRVRGFEDGPGFRALQTVYVGKEKALGKISLPTAIAETGSRFQLHPSLVDAGLHASQMMLIAHSAQDNSPLKPTLPFALKEIEILGPCSTEMWAVAGYSEGSAASDKIQKLDLNFYNNEGNICLKLRGYSSRVLEGEVNGESEGLLLLHPTRKEQKATERNDSNFESTITILCEPELSDEALKELDCQILRARETAIEARFQTYAADLLRTIQTVLEQKPKGKVLIQVITPNDGERKLLSGLSGLLKTAQLESPKLKTQLIAVEPGETVVTIERKIEENRQNSQDQQVCYQNGKRLVVTWQESNTPEASDNRENRETIPWKDNGIYLITGGAGGLGLLFAREIANQTKAATLILTGRSPLNDRIQEELTVLQTFGVNAQYRQTDITQKDSVNQLIRSIQDEFGPLNGVLHSAGIIRDNFIVKKQIEEFQQVLNPKVAGTIHLDQATAGMKLDLFLLFSSMAGGLGNAGQCDYATANSFMDNWATWRNEQVQAGGRQGQTLSINWPLWKDGGMHVDESSEIMMRENVGIQPMQTQNGFKALYLAITSGESQVMVMEGNLKKMKEKLLSQTQPETIKKAEKAAASAVSESTIPAPAQSDHDELRKRVANTLAKQIQELIGLKAETIAENAELSSYGFDSITLTQFSNLLNKEFKLELTPTLFFEYPTLGGLTDYMMEEHRDLFAKRFSIQALPETKAEAEPQNMAPKVEPTLTKAKQSTRFIKKSAFTGTTASKTTGPEPVAIIGISGRFPKSEDVNELWKNLLEDVDCTGPVPENRWDWDLVAEDPSQAKARPHIKLGGFIDGIEEFDPLFFGIAPREAELMDPQQRLLMTYAWKAIEDAGYAPTSLAGTNTAMIVGTATSGYGTLIAQANVPIKGNYTTGNVSSVGPNRMSFFLDIHGPSEPIETACSSSLVAIHRAMEAINSGNCDMAIVGGVNTLVSLETHVSTNRAGMLSPEGHCKTFSNKANGYSRGEGVGMLFLKKLSLAEQANDQIYGIIRGTAENHGGRANSLTAPNPKAQAEVLKMAYTNAGIDPRTISYIEAHGTGTELGDPIEINGLKSAFKDLYKATGNETITDAHCGLSSIKTNIGHLELASGVAGVIKVLLQMKHKTMIKLLHCDEVNPYIDLKESPFYLVRETGGWKQLQDKSGNDIPRRAGVSSFGFGGANAHVVIEEYTKQRQSQAVENDPKMIVLSAKNSDRLKEAANNLLRFIQSDASLNLSDIAYTLQVGREAMEERLALIANNMEELTEKLEAFLNNPENNHDLFSGQVKGNKETLSLFTADEDMAQTITAWAAKGKYTKLLELWVKGLSFDWNQLYEEAKPNRISLPTYPFAKERYWVPKGAPKKAIIAATATATKPEASETAVIDDSDPCKMMLFEEQWHQEALLTNSTASTGTIVCALSDPETRQLFTESLRAKNPNINIVFLAQGDYYQKRSQQDYSLSPMERGDYEQAFETIIEEVGPIEALVYLWPIENRADAKNYAKIATMLQAVGSTKLNPGKLLLTGEANNRLDRCYLESWIGFQRSLGLVLPKTETGLIIHESEQPVSIETWAETVEQELKAESLTNARYKAEERYTLKIQPTTIQFAEPASQSGKTWLITGGFGGLGLLFAEYLANKEPVNLILTGRSPLDAQKEAKIKELEALGSKVCHIQADLCDRSAMESGLAKAKEQFGPIHAVIHSAGIEGAETVLEKEISDFEAVIAPKVAGTLLLDELLQNEPLEYVCYFSSASAILGDMGSCDYAIGNRFQMAHADYRNEQRNSGKRQGKTIAINWPLWRDGGMGRESQDLSNMYLKSSGQRFLKKEEGTELFDQLLIQTGTQYLALVAQPERVTQFLNLTGKTPKKSATPIAPQAKQAGKGRRPEMKGLNIAQCVQWDLKEIASDLLKIPREQLDMEENLADFGFDSINLSEFATNLSDHFEEEVTPSLFFAHPSLKKLVDYFNSEHKQKMEALYQEATTIENPEPVDPEPEKFDIPTITLPKTTRKNATTEKSGQPEPANAATIAEESIAIIGMSGRFPAARNIDEMWQNLAEGNDVVVEIPEDRWPLEGFYHPDAKQAVEEGKSYSKWNGVLPGVKEFDPLFFEISPREAEGMDPRQRLLLQESWKALEDAGYGATHLENKKVGIFVGVEEGDYQNLAGEQANITSGHTGIMAARLAYFMNLSGPNMAINTACSSGLVAVHQACQSLKNQECHTAIAAGINLITTPEPYIVLSQAGMLSKDGKCFAFDTRANGMVPGEAIAVVVLKRKTDAETAGDPIRAVIQASGINHDGRTNGITAPSGTAQTALLKEVYQKNNINPEEIEYIVTHGTGTKLGDPIEINALYDAFKENTKKQEFCALTSTKTNFGHTFAASGVVSLISLVQALHHETIPASLHCVKENDYIQWKSSPFYVNKANKPWPVVAGRERIGAVSSFGMSGTNAHVVIKSYTNSGSNNACATARYYLLPLSAKTEHSLRDKVTDMITFLKRESAKKLDLSAIAYTLQEGRQHFKYRCAIVIQDREDAIHVWNQATGREKLPNLFSGTVNRDFSEQAMMRRYMREQIDQSQKLSQDPTNYQELLFALADLYCQGYEIPWSGLYADKTPQRLHLPTYPFMKEQYWVSGDDPTPTKRKAPVVAVNESSVPKSTPNLTGKVILTPHWEPTTPKWVEKAPTNNDQVVVLGGTEEQKNRVRSEYPAATFPELLPTESIDSLATKLEQFGEINHIIAITPEHSPETVADESLITEQNSGVLACFSLVKALLKLGYATKQLAWTLITTQSQPVIENEPVVPTHASLHGFVGSMAKEFPIWNVRLVDLQSGSNQPWNALFTLPADPTGNGWACRNRQWYRQQLIPIQKAETSTPVYKTGGVYLVIGGAGGIGEAWSEYMIRTWQAQIIWIGRRDEDQTIREKQEALAKLGPAPIYMAADATDLESLEQVRDQIKQQFGAVNGIIHSAIVLQDQSLINMEESRFKSGLTAKVDISVRIAQVFEQEQLDFVLFFSSANAFAKAAGQSNYTAGCVFKDTFARKMANDWSCAVKVMNWGYWGSVGVVTSDAYQERMRKMGMDSIEPAEAMEALETLLNTPYNQMALLKSTQPINMEGLAHNEWTGCYAPNQKIACDTLPANLPKRDEQLQALHTAQERQKMEMEPILRQLLRGQLRSIQNQDTNNEHYQRWFETTSEFLNQQEASDQNNTVNPDTAWNEWNSKKATWSNDPDLSAQAELVEVTLKALPDILTGKRLATEVMFPNSSMELVEGIYKNSGLSEFFNERTGDLVAAFAQRKIEQGNTTKIRILEIGAGTGGTSAKIFPKLRPFDQYIAEYCYTDLSRAFLNHAEQEYKPENPWLKGKLFNVEQPLAEQEIDAGAYDLVIATNVLHATKNIRQTLRNAKAALKTNGLILLNEMNGSSLFTHLTFGLLDGWWLYDDPALRTSGCPGLSPESWQSVLKEEGFQSIFFPEQAAHNLGQQIVIAASNGVVRQKESKDAKQTKQNSTQKQQNEPKPSANLADHLKAVMLENLSITLKIDSSRIDPDESLGDYGLDSITGVQFVQQINQTLNLDLETTTIFEYNSVNQLVAFLLEAHGENLQNISETKAEIEEQSKNDFEPVSQTEIENHLKKVILNNLSDTLKVDKNRIDPDESFGDYGLDSITGVQFIQSLNQELNLELETTVIFEQNTVDQLLNFILTQYKDQLAKIAKNEAQLSTGITALKGSKDHSPLEGGRGVLLSNESCDDDSQRWGKVESNSTPHNATKTESGNTTVENSTTLKQSTNNPIAIVGMSAQFPMAENVEEFWQNIESGKNCVTEIPADRWDWREFYGDPETDPTKTNIKWGGFIDNIQEFDPLFFKIAPKEAERLDPQQRRLLTHVWRTIEDAGTTAKQLSQGFTGVFVALANNEYPVKESASLTPNRISYTLNLKGMSHFYETACSSTLVALHNAIRSIEHGECDQAIVGATNLHLIPDGFISLGQQEILSPTGKARSFQQDADGFVRSEGVGAVLIKPLQKAIEEKNHIYSLILGTGVAHGGKGLSLTAPNAAAMKRAMKQAYRKADINPATVTYMEAHGIASPLGDGIEINALKDCYREIQNTLPKNDLQTLCHIGSLKPMMGNGEEASVLAALIKVTMAMKHKTMPGIPVLGDLNENISLEGSPIRMTDKNQPWNPINDIDGARLPRRAGINSYGFGGVCAHMILEEYIPAKQSAEENQPNKTEIVPLSAMNSERLHEMIQNLLDFVEKQRNLSLKDLAYTLQTGREAMESRLALVANSREELIQHLKEALERTKPGIDKTETSPFVFIGEPREMEIPSKPLTGSEPAEVLASRWTIGVKVPWHLLHQENSVRKISLPTYPFAKERYWIQKESTKKAIESESKPATIIAPESFEQSAEQSTAENIRNYLLWFLGKELNLAADKIDGNKKLRNYGMDSIIGMKLTRDFEKTFHIKITGRELLQYQTVEALSDYLAQKVTDSKTNTETVDPLEQFKQGTLTLEEIESLIAQGEI